MLPRLRRGPSTYRLSFWIIHMSWCGNDSRFINMPASKPCISTTLAWVIFKKRSHTKKYNQLGWYFPLEKLATFKKIKTKPFCFNEHSIRDEIFCGWPSNEKYTMKLYAVGNCCRYRLPRPTVNILQSRVEAFLMNFMEAHGGWYICCASYAPPGTVLKMSRAETRNSSTGMWLKQTQFSYGPVQIVALFDVCN